MTRRLRALLLIGLATSLACSERLAEEERGDERRYCTPLVVYIEEPGSERLRLHDSESGESQSWWCTCIAEDEVDEDFRLWVNEEAHHACLEFVEREGYEPAHSTCQEFYEKGLWGAAFGFNEYDLTIEPPYCDDIDEP